MPTSLRFDPHLLLLLAIVASVNFAAMPAEFMIGDPIAMRAESRALLFQGTLAIPPEVFFGDPGQYFVTNPDDGRLYSKYGLACGLLYTLPVAAAELCEGDTGPWGGPELVLYLNLYNIAWSLLLAALLYACAREFTDRRAIAGAWVLACCFSTYLWYYLRAQNSEIFQSTFFAAAAWCWLRSHRLDAKGRPLPAHPAWFAGLWFSVLALVLTKISYAVLAAYLPAAEVLWLMRVAQLRGPAAVQRSLQRHAAGLVLCAAAVLTVNELKFGSPWLTGYHQWPPQGHGLLGRWSDSLYSLAASPHWSLFLHFAPLVLAVPWIGAWLRRPRGDYAFFVGFAVIYILLVSRLENWRGESCYGPRYFLFILPFLSLPALNFAERAWAETSQRRQGLLLAAAALLLGYSTWQQYQVNRFPFFTYYEVTRPLREQMPLPAAAYFLGHHYGSINADLSDPAEKYRELEWWREFARASPTRAVEFRSDIRKCYAQSNWFW